MAIDWTKPVETDEETPRQVKVLFDRDGRPDAARIDDNASSPNLNLFALQHVGSTVHATRGMYSIPLRNVAPKPVRLEAFANLYPNGVVTLHFSEDDAELCNHNGTAETRRIVWHSDGSPVDDTVSKEEYDRVCAERDGAIRDFNDLAQGSQEIVDGLKSELSKRDAVINAAVSWRNEITGSGLGKPAQRLYDEVCVFAAKQVVKSCDNCANGPIYSENCTSRPCAPSYDVQKNQWSNWEPKR